VRTLSAEKSAHEKEQRVKREKSRIVIFLVDHVDFCVTEQKNHVIQKH